LEPQPRPRILFLTGRLAEPALRRQLAELAQKADFEPVVAVMPISVAALMPAEWIGRRLGEPPPGIARAILPGHVRGDLDSLARSWGFPVERGPKDVRDLPAHFGFARTRPADYGEHDLEILAEINHAGSLSRPEVLEIAARYRRDGADRIDLGCDPGGPWPGVADAVKALRDAGHRVSIDSFDPVEVAAAVKAGADLVLSVNTSNRERAADWGVEVVAIPDRPEELRTLFETREWLADRAVPFRLDPILEPLGLGFTASVVRYAEVRRKYPEDEMLMGIGNVTELTDTDSGGLNVMMVGICAELGIRSVLTTEVIRWARTSVREIDLARRLMHYAVTHSQVPKYLEPDLITLRDAKTHEFGPVALRELQATIKDPNWRLFAENGMFFALNADHFLAEVDPFELFAKMGVDDPSHAFYLGHELAKAQTALTLGKWYRQDQALNWGYLTAEERTHWSGPGQSRPHSPAATDAATDKDSTP
jgi:dihydropteroate synthase